MCTLARHSKRGDVVKYPSFEFGKISLNSRPEETGIDSEVSYVQMSDGKIILRRLNQ
jgi:hypothetical protein